MIVAGQTAPDPGITLIRGGLTVETSDVTIQHIAVRPGDRSSGAPDALGTHRGSAGPVHHVVFDHCSATWAIDENLSASGPADVDSSKDPDATSHDVVLRDCLIAEGLMHATHPKGAHSMGTLVHDGVRNVTISGCLYAHNNERNPRLKGGTTATITGNVMYNWGSACIGIGSRGNQRILQPARAWVADTIAIPGPDTRYRELIKHVDPGGEVTLRNNVVVGASRHPEQREGSRERDASLSLSMTRGPSPREAGRGWSRTAGPGEGSAAATVARVLRTAGARPARRDPIDRRIVQSVIDGSGRIIDSQEEVGGYPKRPPARRALTVPEDPDARRRWLDALANELAEDKTVDLSPLLRRLNVAPSPGLRK